MTPIERYTPPTPSLDAVVQCSKPADLADGLLAAYAVDLPPACRAEVEAALRYFLGDCADNTSVQSYLDARFGPAPAMVMGQTAHGAVTALPLAVPSNVPMHLCDKPETLAFLRVLAQAQRITEYELCYDAARAFLAATDPEGK